jgi:hypothetical protein
MGCLQEEPGEGRDQGSYANQLFGKPNNNIVNELDGSTEPTLF